QDEERAESNHSRQGRHRLESGHPLVQMTVNFTRNGLMVVCHTALVSIAWAQAEPQKAEKPRPSFEERQASRDAVLAKMSAAVKKDFKKKCGVDASVENDHLVVAATPAGKAPFWKTKDIEDHEWIVTCNGMVEVRLPSGGSSFNPPVTRADAAR